MADNSEIAAQALEEKANSLVAERTKLRLRMATDAVRDMQLSRDINGCIAGASALGWRIEVSGLPAAGTANLPQEHTAFVTARNALIPLVQYFAAQVPPDLTETASGPALPSSAAPPPMPKVADVVMERLRVAGNDGAKAIDIRNFILQTYHREIHEKTVGMTLYRLQEKGRVRREGHTWFLASVEAGNPGTAMPGSINAISEKE